MPIYRSKNSDFFKKWSQEMAYILGYFAADGTMIKNKRGAHYIEFWSTDKELIVGVKKLLISEHKIASFYRKERWKKIYRIQLGSREIFNDLLGLGFTPNKSLNVQFPPVPRKYLAHFTRGYFDGDGHVSSGIYKRSQPRKNPYIHVLLSGFTCGSKSFLVNLKHKLASVAGLKGGTSCCLSRAYRLNYSINDSRRLYNFMYTEVPEGLYLKRKKKVFENFFKGR